MTRLPDRAAAPAHVRETLLVMKLMFLLALVGCAPTVPTPATTPNATPESYTKLNESPRPMKPRAPATVQLYRTKHPDAPYVEVGELGDTGGDEAAALDKLELSAAGVGCDGLIVGSARNERTVADFTGNGARVAGVALSGTCIMFEQDPGTWRPSEFDVRCNADKERLFAAKDPDEKAAIARSIPPECNR